MPLQVRFLNKHPFIQNTTKYKYELSYKYFFLTLNFSCYNLLNLSRIIGIIATNSVGFNDKKEMIKGNKKIYILKSKSGQAVC